MEYNEDNSITYNIYDKINIYLTGYGPFLTVRENPAEKVSNYIFENSSKLNTQYTSILYNQIFEVTTEYVNNNISKLFNFIKKFDNIKENNQKFLNIIISFGVAENRMVDTLEIRAKNYIYDRIVDKKIDENKPDYYYSKCPIKYIIKGIQQFNNSECKYSNDAGEYLCNYMYFTTLSKCFDEKDLCSFFLHIPKLENYSMDKHEIFFKNLINVLECLYIKGNEEKRKKILELDINEEKDEHIDEWNKKSKKEKNKNENEIIEKDKEDKKEE